LEQPDVREEIEGLLRSRGLDVPTGSMRVVALKAHRHRCTFEASFGSEDLRERVILKVYDRDRSAVFTAMESIVAAGFGPGAEYAIPRPIAYLRSAHVLVQEWIPGTRAIEIFMRDEAEPQREAARRCGAWLAHFHAKAPRQGRVAELDGLLKGIRYWAGEVQKAGEPLSSKADALLQKLEASVPSAGYGSEPRPAHGSYMPDHVMLSGARTVTIDIDEYEMTDPARDLAWFIVSLERLGLERRQSLRLHDRAIEEFVRSYVARGPRDAASHLAFYKAVWCLHQANRDLYYRLSPLPDWSEVMLDEGIAALGP
jgi:aminoglycoside phosphotransferase (APT) family kinase protein